MHHAHFFASSFRLRDKESPQWPRGIKGFLEIVVLRDDQFGWARNGVLLGRTIWRISLTDRWGQFREGYTLFDSGCLWTTR